MPGEHLKPPKVPGGNARLHNQENPEWSLQSRVRGGRHIKILCRVVKIIHTPPLQISASVGWVQASIGWPEPIDARATSDQIESEIQSDRIKLLAKIKDRAFSD
jgi:hypothetical protein